MEKTKVDLVCPAVTSLWLEPSLPVVEGMGNFSDLGVSVSSSGKWG
jgi:hypothetical protein